MFHHEQFSESKDQPCVGGPDKTVLIASTPRCGSHMLGHALGETGHVGVPYEYCNPGNLVEWHRRLGTTTTDEALQQLMYRRTTPNGVFSVKAHFSHTAQFGTPADLLARFPHAKVVFIRRADVLRQAISYAVARQTGVWITGQQATSDRVCYDADLISACLDDIALQNARWASYFKRAGIETCDVFYEAMARDLGGTIRSIAEFADILLPEESLVTEAPIQRQGQETRTEAWIERYTADRRPARPGFLRRARRRLQGYSVT
ncbi:Stf0 family sulfotransferase [Roseovarius tibetensis]|uniref:Stf0 family sulfotransferase n=1 Tax=Roseovarius tibetensis TaxID=2685897 RepID=UPI003D7FDA1A